MKREMMTIVLLGAVLLSAAGCQGQTAAPEESASTDVTTPPPTVQETTTTAQTAPEATTAAPVDIPSPEPTPPETVHPQAEYPEGVTRLEGEERISYLQLAQDAVWVQLTRPETATFSDQEDDWAIFRNGDYVEVSSWVDGMDTADQWVNSTFTVQFQDESVVYLRIDQAESGTKLG